MKELPLYSVHVMEQGFGRQFRYDVGAMLLMVSCNCLYEVALGVRKKI
jgi:hypothetical protein